MKLVLITFFQDNMWSLYGEHIKT